MNFVAVPTQDRHHVFQNGDFVVNYKNSGGRHLLRELNPDEEHTAQKIIRFTNYTLRVLSLNQAPKPPSTTLPPSGCTPAIETRMEGEFNGWEPTSSPDMEPYLRLIMAEMREVDPTAELEALRQLPLEKRYVWRVASALQWGFADFDSVNVDADRETLTPKDFAKVMDLLKLYPLQFCIFLKSLVGPEEMQRMMVEATKVAKQV